MNKEDARAPIIFLMGPTASGKTVLACELASHHPIELISVDSALVYRGMDIGTAKPDAQMLERFPHRLVNIRDPQEIYSAADFRADALREIERIIGRGRIPLLVGGTGLYFRALERGLSALPEADAEVRADLAREAVQAGKESLHARLAGLDPVTATRLNVNDIQRVQRALEVIALSGRPLSEMQGAPKTRLPYRVLKLALLPIDRAPLHARIANRVDAMLEAGLVAELGQLRERPSWSADLPSMRAVGYRQGWPYLDGSCSLDDFRIKAIHATRQLAKRQITWLRAELDALTFDPDAASAADKVEFTVDRFLDLQN